MIVVIIVVIIVIIILTIVIIVYCLLLEGSTRAEASSQGAEVSRPQGISQKFRVKQS